MKICMFLDNPITNDPRVKAESSALAAAGNDVTVIGTRVKGKSEFEEWEGVKFERIFVKPNKLEKTVNFIKALPLIVKGKNKFLVKYKINMLCLLDNKYINRVKGRKYDVIHSNDVFLLRAASIAAENCGAKLVYDSHEFFYMGYFDKGRKISYVKRKLYEEYLRRQKVYANKADLVIVSCDGTANALKELISLKELPITIYNTAKLYGRKKLNIIRSDYIHTSDDRPIVLYQGCISTGRGLLQFVDMAKECPDADFVIIGPVSSPSYNEKLVEKAKDVSNMHILESVPYEKLWQITVSCDFGYYYIEAIHRAYDMAVSNKIFEYLSAGLPIITGYSLGAVEVRDKIAKYYDSENNPMLLLPKDEEQMPKATYDILHNCDYKLLSNNAYEIAEKYFNQSIELKKVVNAYNELMK